MRPTPTPQIPAPLLLYCRPIHAIGESGDAGDERNQSTRTRRENLAGVICWQFAALAQSACQPSESVDASGFFNRSFFCANLAALGHVAACAVRMGGEHDPLINLAGLVCHGAGIDRKSVVWGKSVDLGG